jgi:hypothetical protein
MKHVDCQRCGQAPPVSTSDRYCKICQKQVLAELQESGYLTAWPRTNAYRSSDMREDTYETRHGIGHG